VELAAAWKDYRKSRDTAPRNRLMEHYLPNVKYYCEWLHTRMPDQVQLDDVISHGIEGLRQAIQSFDPSRGVRFETYLSFRVRGAIRDNLRRTDWAPRSARRQATQLQHERETLASRLGREPDDAELARAMGLSEKRLNALRRRTATLQMDSLNRVLSTGDDGEEFRELDTLADTRAADPARQLVQKDLCRTLTQGLSATERMILMLYYYEQMTMRELGATLNLSESRVSQIHTALLARLRETLGARRDAFADAVS